MIPQELSPKEGATDPRVLFIVHAAKKDTQSLRYRIGQAFENISIPLSDIKENVGAYPQEQRIRAAIDASSTIAPLESSWLHARLTFVMSRRHILIEKSYDIAQRKPENRIRQWATLSPILNELAREIHLLPVEATECNDFVSGLKHPEDRYYKLRLMARDKLNAIRSLLPEDEQVRGQHRLLQKLYNGMLGPSAITLFDILRASERIRQGRMDIERYKV